jgi:RNA polymerase sigma factor (sigma-70 family)
MSPVARWLARLARPAGSPSDAMLLDRFVASGDGAAFAELARRYGPMVWAVCRRLAPDPHAAEDAFQATFLVLVRKPARVRRAASAAGYLHGVARRVSVRCRRRPTLPLAEVAAAADADPQLVAARREEAEALHAELAGLPAGCREAVLLTRSARPAGESSTSSCPSCVICGGWCRS